MLEILSVSIFSDNYVYLLHDSADGLTVVIDPGAAEPVLTAVQSKGWQISHMLITHNCWDHIGGVDEIQRATDCTVIGPGDMADGEEIVLGQHRAKVLTVPGHTSEHVAYWFAQEHALFCGDTLFSMGCGRMHGDRPAQFWPSLKKLRDLPNETLVYCAHEYTLANIEFALTVDPDNEALFARQEEAQRMLLETGSSLPSRLGDEKAGNPFLRADDPEIQQCLGMSEANPVRVFAELRGRKDQF